MIGVFKRRKPSKMWNTPDGREIPEENDAPAEIKVLDIEIDDDVNRRASENDRHSRLN